MGFSKAGPAIAASYCHHPKVGIPDDLTLSVGLAGIPTSVSSLPASPSFRAHSGIRGSGFLILLCSASTSSSFGYDGISHSGF